MTRGGRLASYTFATGRTRKERGELAGGEFVDVDDGDVLRLDSPKRSMDTRHGPRRRAEHEVHVHLQGARTTGHAIK